MEVVTSVEQMKKLRHQIKGSVGFVPTMGFLHQGHLSLVKQSKTDTDITVTSIYVNPTQFGPGEDFKKYPRDTKRDFELLEIEHNNIVFMPSSEEMYPEHYDTWVEVGELTNYLEGKRRPGHFKGVTTIVNKLFNIVSPDKAYLGQKDAQQVVVLQKMVKDLNMNVEIVVMPTLRETDGLAMSSRNVYLNPDERRAAPVLYKSLILARQLRGKGETNSATIKDKMISLITNEPLISIDYISIADCDTLRELPQLNERSLVSLAAKLGNTTLIDNLII
jgi:pantoate--beta-alanine ligase